MSNGSSKTYYKEGQIAAEENYKNGNLDGTCKTYYRNGEIESEYNYKDGFRHGACKEYDKGGKLIKEKEYVDGILNGSREYFYLENGQLKKTVLHEKEAPDDTFKVFWYDVNAQ